MKRFIGYEFQCKNIYSVLVSLKQVHPRFYWQRDLLKWMIIKYLRRRQSDIHILPRYDVHESQKNTYLEVMEHQFCAVDYKPQSKINYNMYKEWGRTSYSNKNPMSDTFFYIVCAFVLYGLNVHVFSAFGARSLISDISWELNLRPPTIETLFCSEKSNGLVHYGATLRDWETTQFHFIITFDDENKTEIANYRQIYPDTCVLRIKINK